MSAFTMPLKRVIEITGGTYTVEPMTFKGVDMGAIGKVEGAQLGIERMPIWDEAYRSILAGKIVDHFWNREIGFETIDLFQMKARTKLNEIMPYWNRMYESTEIPYEALSTMRVHTESQTTSQQSESNSATTTGESDSTASARAVQSQTPQTMLAGNEDYATSANDSNSQSAGTTSTESEGVASSTGEAEGDTLVTGYQGSASDLIMRYRDSLINIDLMVIRDLEELFMQVFDNGDSYTQRGFWL